MRRGPVLLVAWFLPILPSIAGGNSGETPASAQPVHLRLEPGAIEILGINEGSTGTYSNGIVLTADVDVTLSATASALTEAGTAPKQPGGLEIPITSIRINSDAPFPLQKNVPRVLIVSVASGFPRGRFCGILNLSSPLSSALEPSTIPVCLTVSPKPNIATIPASLNFKLTRCGSNLTCRVAEFLAPGGQTGGALHWQLTDSAFSGAVPVIASMVTLHGDKTGDLIYVPIGQWSKDDRVAPLKEAALPTLGQHAIDLAFDVQGRLRADHYQGQYPIGVRNGAAVSWIPVSLDVRNGPLLALCILAVGVVLGRLIQASNSARSQSQMKLLDRYNSVSSAVSSIQDAANKRFLEINLENARADIRLMARSEQDVINDLDLLDKLAADAQKLDMWLTHIASEPNANLKLQMQTSLTAARAAINCKNLSIADAQITEIINLLGQSTGAAQQAAAASARRLPVPARGVGAPVAAPAAAAPAAVTRAPRGAERAVLKVLSWMSGAEPVGEGWYHYGRPVVYVLLLLGLALVGLYNLYVRNSTFGSDGFFDYLTLFLWGISADVAQKSLQQLSLTGSR
jgi:hypothetical protein